MAIKETQDCFSPLLPLRNQKLTLASGWLLLEGGEAPAERVETEVVLQQVDQEENGEQAWRRSWKPEGERRLGKSSMGLLIGFKRMI